MTIHSVRSAPHVLNIVEKERLLENNKAVLHWFSGSLSDAKRAVDLGFYFSINIEMLSKPKCTDLLKLIPKTRIITETDGPFILHNHVPQKPENIVLCMEKLSHYWNQSPAEVSATIITNLSNLEN